MKWGINDTQHCTITDVWFLTHCYNTTDYKTSYNNIRVILSASTIQALKTFDINYDGPADVGELEALDAAGAIQVISLNPYFKIQQKAA